MSYKTREMLFAVCRRYGLRDRDVAARFIRAALQGL